MIYDSLCVVLWCVANRLLGAWMEEKFLVSSTCDVSGC